MGQRVFEKREGKIVLTQLELFGRCAAAGADFFGGGDDMPIYPMLTHLTDEGRKAVKLKPGRIRKPLELSHCFF